MKHRRLGPPSSSLLKDAAAAVAVALLGAAIVLWTTIADFHLSWGRW